MKLWSPKIRRFKFQSYYYDPGKDVEEGEARIKFKRLRKSPKPQSKSSRRTVIFLIMVGYFIWYLSSVEQNQPLQVEKIQVEDISLGPE